MKKVPLWLYKTYVEADEQQREKYMKKYSEEYMLKDVADELRGYDNDDYYSTALLLDDVVECHALIGTASRLVLYVNKFSDFCYAKSKFCNAKYMEISRTEGEAFASIDNVDEVQRKSFFDSIYASEEFLFNACPAL